MAPEKPALQLQPAPMLLPLEFAGQATASHLVPFSSHPSLHKAQWSFTVRSLGFLQLLHLESFPVAQVNLALMISKRSQVQPLGSSSTFFTSLVSEPSLPRMRMKRL